jgi:hypothetical protein
MSCWVVPEIAADLWGIPLEQLMERIDDGSVPTRREGDFIFVDVKPQLAGAGEDDRQDTSTMIFQIPRWENSRDEIAARRRPPQAA